MNANWAKIAPTFVVVAFVAGNTYTNTHAFMYRVYSRERGSFSVVVDKKKRK